ncbi:MAG: hypothetical protein ACI9DG_001975 [Oleispira sp.]|jgi:hypothetical protein
MRDHVDNIGIGFIPRAILIITRKLFDIAYALRAWKGKILRTNNSVLDLAEWCIIRPLSFLGIKWGKRYRTQHQGDPLLFRWADKVYFPIPIWGNVGMNIRGSKQK